MKDNICKRPHIICFGLYEMFGTDIHTDNKYMTGYNTMEVQEEIRGNETWLLNGSRVSFGGDKNSLCSLLPKLETLKYQ